MDAVNEVPFHVDGVVRRKPHLHSKIVVVFTVHDSGMNHTGTIGGCDPISRQDGPCRRGVTAWDSIWEQWLVGFTNQRRSGYFFDDVDMVTEYFPHQILCENQFLANRCTTSSLPALGFLTNTTASIGHIRSNSETNVSRKGPRRSGPSEDGCRIINQFEFHVDGRFLDFFVAQSYFVTRIGCSGLWTIG